jgi:hypothetical protein
MGKMNHNSRWALIILSLLLIYALSPTTLTWKAHADDGAVGQYETIVTTNNGHRVTRAVFPAKPPKDYVPATNSSGGNKSLATANSNDVNVAGSEIGRAHV